MYNMVETMDTEVPDMIKEGAETPRVDQWFNVKQGRVLVLILDIPIMT